jgi:intermediate peptidase
VQERKVATLLLQDFEKSGVHMDLESRQKFIELNDSILKLGQEFSLNATPSEQTITFKDAFKSLDGVPSALLTGLCRRSGGKTAVVPTNSEIALVLLRSAKSDAARRDLFLAMNSASKSQVETLESMLKKRAELATLLGKDSYAQMYLVDKMVETPGKFC